ncbi:MAG: hypothetical protein ACF8XB_10715 [Planctomycetota bacterium JB042]
MLKPTLVTLSLLMLAGAPLDAEAASRRVKRATGTVEAAETSAFSVGVVGGAPVAVKVVARRGLVPRVAVLGPDGEELERARVQYSRSGRVLKFMVRAPEGARRLKFEVTGRNGSAGGFKAKVQQRGD